MNTPTHPKRLQKVNISLKTLTLTFDTVDRYYAILYCLVLKIGYGFEFSYSRAEKA